MSEKHNFERVQRAVFDELNLSPESHYIDLAEPSTSVHIIDYDPSNGEDTPILFLHSGGTFGALFAPLIAALDDTRCLAMDRPGFGLSDSFRYHADTYRQTAIEVITGVLDGLDIEEVDLAGNSNGGYWSIVHALEQPERIRRLSLLGSLPTLPGTSSPLPLRLYTVPVLNQLLGRMFLSGDAEDVIDKYEIFGEGESIQRYPALIDAIVARDAQSHAHDLDISEMKSLLTVRGWREVTRLNETDLQGLRQPTLVIWGEDDPLGGPDDVRETLELIPDVRLEALDGGHVPWLGYPEKCAEHIRDFRDRTR